MTTKRVIYFEPMLLTVLNPQYGYFYSLKIVYINVLKAHKFYDSVNMRTYLTGESLLLFFYDRLFVCKIHSKIVATRAFSNIISLLYDYNVIWCTEINNALRVGEQSKCYYNIYIGAISKMLPSLINVSFFSLLHE